MRLVKKFQSGDKIEGPVVTTEFDPATMDSSNYVFKNGNPVMETIYVPNRGYYIHPNGEQQYIYANNPGTGDVLYVNAEGNLGYVTQTPTGPEEGSVVSAAETMSGGKYMVVPGYTSIEPKKTDAYKAVLAEDDESPDWSSPAWSQRNDYPIGEVVKESPIQSLSDLEIAKQILKAQGGYGNGADRRKVLGDRYSAVQAEVNRLLNKSRVRKQAQAAAQIGVPTESGVERTTGFVTPDEIIAEMVRRAEWDKNVSEMYDLPMSSVTPEQLAMGAVRTGSPASKTSSDFSSTSGANTGKNMLGLSGDESRSDITSAANLALKENQDIYTSMLSANRKNYKGIKAGLKAERDKQLAGAKDKSSKKEVKKNYSEEKSKAKQEKRDQRRRLRSGHKAAAKRIREKADAARKNAKE